MGSKLTQYIKFKTKVKTGTRIRLNYLEIELLKRTFQELKLNYSIGPSVSDLIPLFATIVGFGFVFRASQLMQYVGRQDMNLTMIISNFLQRSDIRDQN